jgi:hypothetical protein
MSRSEDVICLDNQLESPPNRLIRKTPPTSIPADTAVVVKKQKTNSPGPSKRRIRVGDFDQLTKSLTEDCIAIYRAQIGAVQPFPVKTDNLQAVQLAWVEVCKIRNIQMDLDDSVFKAVCRAALWLTPHTNISRHQVTDRASQIRGQVKTITKTNLFVAYGIDDVNDSQRDVRNKIEQLLEEFRFVYKVCFICSIFLQSYSHFRTLRRRLGCIWPRSYKPLSTTRGSAMQKMTVSSTLSSPIMASSHL